MNVYVIQPVIGNIAEDNTDDTVSYKWHTSQANKDYDVALTLEKKY